MTSQQFIVRKALREAARRHGLGEIENIIDAMGYVETRWKLGLTNNTGGDAARGGAWGPTQITARTAKEHGYLGDVKLFNTDATLAAEWTCKILMGRPGGVPHTVEDVGAWWNAGRSSASRLKPDHITMKDYIPKLREAVYICTMRFPFGPVPIGEDEKTPPV